MRINSAGGGGHSMKSKRMSGGIARVSGGGPRITKCLMERRAGSV